MFLETFTKWYISWNIILDKDIKDEAYNWLVSIKPYISENLLALDPKIEELWNWVNKQTKNKLGKLSFDTGGYTGAWGSDGRWAMVHEKELVLNANDTKDILDAVQLVRQMESSGLSQIFDASKFNLNAFKENDTIEQRVEINANFPDVTSADEIKQALLALADNAYINAHRIY